MSKPKRKPKHKSEPTANPAADVPQVSQVSQVSEVPQLHHVPQTPLDKDCPACHSTQLARARFCNRCGEPLLPGLERPPQLFTVVMSAPVQAPAPAPAPAPVDSPIAPPISPSQVTVLSAPRIGAARSGGATIVPVLAAERPIPASLLNPDALLQGAVASPAVSAPESRPPVVQEALPSTASQPVLPATPPPAAKAETQVDHPPEPAPAPQPLWDLQTETRILALRTGHEMTSDRFERVMAGFKLKPKPRAPAAKPKAAPKDAGKDKGKPAAKPAAKPAKGH